MLRVLIVNFACISMIMGIVGSVAKGNGQDRERIIGKVEVYGNASFSSEVIMDAMTIRQGGMLPSGWPEKAMENLLSWYFQQGFYLARIDSIRERTSLDSQSVELALWISEGGTVRIGRVEILGSEGLPQQDLVKLLETRTGRVFKETVLEQDIDHILTFLENRGYPLGRVEIRSLSLSYEGYQPEVNVGLNIEQGPVVTIDSINVEGNELTKERVILRETRLKPGQLYKHEDVISIREKLQRLGTFKEVAEPEVVFIRDRAVITLRVKDENSSTIDGVLGYNPSTREGNPGYFTGRLQFTFRNLLGTGRFLEAYWEKKDEYSQAMRFGYEEPWLLGWPLHIGGQFQQEIRDTTYVEREWKFSIRVVPWASLSMRLTGGQKEVLPDSLGSIQYALPQTKSWLLSAGIDYNTLDDPLNPRKGVRYHTTLIIGRKRNIGPDFLTNESDWKDVVHTRLLQVDAETVFPTFSRQVVYFGLHGTEVRTGDRFVPLSDQIRFGGTRTLRGYAEDVFRGTLVAWLNGEYRYLLGRHSRAFVFVDCGIYQRREKELGLVKGTKVGYGIGLRLETRLGIMGVDYGLGEGDSLMRGKIHVGLVNRF